jgi:hypothetical protein
MSRPFAGVGIDVFGRGVKRHPNPLDDLAPAVFSKALRPDSEPLDLYGDNYEDEETRFDFGNAFIHTPIALRGVRAFGDRKEPIVSEFLDGEIVFRLDALDVDTLNAAMRATVDSPISLHMLNTILANDQRFLFECEIDGRTFDCSILMDRIHRAGVLVDRLSAAGAEAAAPSGGYVTEGGTLINATKPRACKVVPYGDARVRNLWPRARPGSRLFLRIILVRRNLGATGGKSVADGAETKGDADLRDCCIQIIPFCECDPRQPMEFYYDDRADGAHVEDDSGSSTEKKEADKKLAPKPKTRKERLPLPRGGPSSFIHGGLYTGKCDDNVVWEGGLMFVGTMLSRETPPPEAIHQRLVDTYACSAILQNLDDASIQRSVETSIRSCMALPLCQVAIAALP